MNLPIMEEDIYGYPISGAAVLIIAMKEEEALALFQAVRGRSGYRYEAVTDLKTETAPDEICIFSGETWYLVRFHSFSCISGRISFVMYFMKAQYMAAASLLKYRKKARSADRQNREYFLFSDKVDEACQNAEKCTGNDIIRIVDTAENADESFGSSGQKQQNADIRIDLQHGHGNDHA